VIQPRRRIANNNEGGERSFLEDLAVSKIMIQEFLKLPPKEGKILSGEKTRKGGVVDPGLGRILVKTIKN